MFLLAFGGSQMARGRQHQFVMLEPCILWRCAFLRGKIMDSRAHIKNRTQPTRCTRHRRNDDTRGLDIGVCIGRTARLHNKQFYTHNGYPATVADMIGAGDSFLAALICYLIYSRRDAAKSLDIACTVGALVAEHTGANLCITQKMILDKIANAKNTDS